MKKVTLSPFEIQYQLTIQKVNGLIANARTKELKVCIALNILAELYEGKKVTIENLRDYRAELSNFLINEKLDKSFGYVLAHFYHSQNLITTYIWGNKKFSVKVLKEIFADSRDCYFQNNDVINGIKFHFIAGAYELMEKKNMRFIAA